MNTKQRIELLTKWKSHHDKLEDAFNTLFAAGFGPESPVFEAAWMMFDGYTRAVAKTVGDIEIFWMFWFHHENKMGEKAMEAGYDGKLKKIRTIADLVKLIETGINK